MFFPRIICVYCSLEVLLSSVCLLACSERSNPVSEHLVQRIYRARADMDIESFEQLLLELETTTCDHDECAIVSYYLSFIHFNIAVHYFNCSERDQSFAHLEEALRHIDQSLCFQATADAYILKAHGLDFHVLFEPQRTADFMRSMWQCLGQAAHLEPNNPRLYLVKGLHYYFAPSYAGGDRQRAKECLKKAVQLFISEDQQTKAYPRWGYEDALAWLGQIAVHEDSLDLAVYYYNQALLFNKNFNWIKDELLPQARDKFTMNSSLATGAVQFIALASFVLLFFSIVFWIIKIKFIRI
ncbi:hypothetical protein EH223_14140 [candidate division KSB1 bacterium]|nr:hypothetical protein [candidate division KSB1 bacterium]RQW01831.1 MAG: hypothetical protein EH223_14140 [candidate division KSB1 bacterium]